MALSKILPAGQDQFAGARNLIINGNMACWQRGTSVTGATSGGVKTADRWHFNASGGTMNQSQQIVTLGDSVVGDFKYFLRSEFTTGDDNTGITQRIEDVQSVLEGSVTLSFYAKGTNPNSGHIGVKARQYFGTGGSPSTNVVIQSQDVVLTSSWQRFVLTFTIPSLSGKVLGTNNDNFFEVYFQQPNDDDNASAWTLDITGVQLEVGETATPFEHRSFGDELAKCQRYYAKSTGQNVHGKQYNSGTWLGDPQYPVTMRATPSVTATTGGSYNNIHVGTSTDKFYFDKNSQSCYITGWLADAEL